MRIRERQTGLIAALVAGGMLLFAAPAGAATTLFASPTGDNAGGTNLCTDSINPCTIERAVEGITPDVTGEDIELFPGTYNLTDSLVFPTTGANPEITVHGTPGATRPTINVTGAGPSGAGVSVKGILRDVNVNVPAGVGAPTRAVTLEDGNDLVERVHAQNANANRFGCDVAGTVRDTVCWASGQGGSGARLDVGGGFMKTGTLRNVTAIGSGTTGLGINVFAGGANSSATITATNVIARGGVTDITVAGADGTDSATVTLDHSNYATTSTTGSGTLSITPAGGGTNLTTAPAFVDAANGDFRQAPSSTGTIDLGDDIPVGVGELDLDGQTRILGAHVDIGADELAHFTTASVACLPASVTAGSGTTCTVTVNDPLAPPVPAGAPGLSSNLAGAFGAPCILAGSTTQSTCQATFTPSAPGSHLITAAYGGDPTHDGSQATTTLDVAAAPTPPPGATTPPSATTPPATARKKCKKKRHRSAVAAKKCKKRKR